MSNGALWILLFVSKLVLYTPFIYGAIEFPTLWLIAGFGIIDLISMIQVLWYPSGRDFPVWWENQPPVIKS